MSRIHDALKKAEELQLANLGSVPEFKAEEPAPEPFPEIAVDLVTAGELAPIAMAATAPPAKVVSATESILQNRATTVWNPSKDALFLTSKDDHAPGMEEFRTLRSKLFQIRAKRPLKALLISSALPGEGKSFVSSNLAQALARQRGGRTLLIDADLRKPHLHESLGAPNAPGLFEVLSGKATELDVVQKSNYDDLFFIPGGGIRSSAAELIGNGRMRELLDRLTPLFNWIVIDSSPVIPVSDPTRLAEFCDGVLLVVCAGSTPHAVAQRAKQEFHQSPVLGVVFNRVPRKENPYYKYSYGSYGRGPSVNS